MKVILVTNSHSTHINIFLHYVHNNGSASITLNKTTCHNNSRLYSHALKHCIQLNVKLQHFTLLFAIP